MKERLEFWTYFVLFIVAAFFTSCAHKQKNALFTQLSSTSSGIHFSNDVHDNDSSRSFINEFGYMGGGVGIGDFNNDGLKDIFFSGNQVSYRQFLVCKDEVSLYKVPEFAKVSRPLMVFASFNQLWP